MAGRGAALRRPVGAARRPYFSQRAVTGPLLPLWAVLLKSLAVIGHFKTSHSATVNSFQMSFPFSGQRQVGWSGFLEPFSFQWHKSVMDEDQLVTALKARDPAATRELVGAYGDRLLRSAFTLCGNETEAQDLVQDTFIQAMRSAGRFQGRSTVYTWLHGILLNLTRHYHRNRKWIVYDDRPAGREVSPSEESPAPLDCGTASVALAEALRQLSRAHREAIVLRYYEDMKIQEIARRLGISKGTVKSRLHYALAELQKLLPAELNLFGACGTEKIQKQ
jgi:RNA polymerase sigma-70 factor (ECF subfamily)